MLGLVRGKRRNVNQSRNPIICSRGRDDAAAIRVADQDGRAADTPQRAEDGGDIASVGVEAMLAGDHLKPLRLKPPLRALREQPRLTHAVPTTTRRVFTPA